MLYQSKTPRPAALFIPVVALRIRTKGKTEKRPYLEMAYSWGKTRKEVMNDADFTKCRKGSNSPGID
jgi:hypothetical protein